MSHPQGTDQRAVRRRARLGAGRSLLLCATGALLVSAAVGFSGASFTAQTANPGNSFAAAASFCTNPGTQTVTAAADSYIAEESPGTNFGGNLDVRVRSRSGARNQRTLVRFNLPTAPNGCSVTGATLRLFATTATNGRTVEAYRAAAAWAEMTVNWTNRPGFTGTAATSASGTGWRSWNVTTHVSAMYAGQNNGFVVKDSVEGSTGNQEQVYQSREGAAGQRPELVLTFG